MGFDNGIPGTICKRCSHHAAEHNITPHEENSKCYGISGKCVCVGFLSLNNYYT